MTYTIPASTPQAQGIDPRAIRATVEAWEAAGTRPFALTVIRHGHVVAETTWAPYEPTDTVQKYSLSKTFTASAVGMAVADGLVDLDAPVVSYFPGVSGVGPRAQRILVRNLLSMASGHVEDTVGRIDPSDPVGSFLRLEPDQEPGSVFCYNQGCTLTLSAIVQTVTGEVLHDYLRPRLFDPFGIGPVEWLTVGPYDMGFAGLHVPNSAVARLGLTLLQRGEYGGQRVLPAAWCDEAMTVHVPNGPQNADWEQGYGFQMWRSRHGWRGDGAFGQLCLVLADEDMVVAVSAQVDDMQRELDIVWDNLLPGLSDGPLPENDEEADELEAFLAARQLPTIASTVTSSEGRYELVASGSAAAMVASGGVELDAHGLTLDDGAGPVTVPLGDGTWASATVALAGGGITRVAGTGGWTAPDVLEARLVGRHSPHVLDVRVDVVARTAELTWQTQPLGNVSLTRKIF